MNKNKQTFINKVLFLSKNIFTDREYARCVYHTVQTKMYIVTRFLWRMILINMKVIGATLCFIGTLIIVIDRFGPIHNFVDKHSKWYDVILALEDIQQFDYKTSDGDYVGHINSKDSGFNEILRIVKSKRPDLREKEVIGIVMNRPMEIGGVPFGIVHVAIRDEPKALSLTTEYIFYEWIRDSRDKWFLKIGITIIAVGFLLTIVGQFQEGGRRRNKISSRDNGVGLKTGI